MITIRQAKLTDLPQLVALDQEIFGVYGADESPDVTRARLEVFLSGCAVLEEKSPNKEDLLFAGYLTTEKWNSAREPALDEDPYLTHQPEGRILCITTLAIAPRFQNQGLGKRLLDHAIEIAQAQMCKKIILETARAKRFYLKHGFEQLGIRTERGIELYIMGLEL